MGLREPANAVIEPGSGVIEGATGRYAKTLDELAGLYRDEAAYAALAAERGGEVVYEVYEFRPSERAGDLIFGTSIMKPGRVGREFFLTRGHLHRIADRPEVYYCQAGRGVMLMESLDGEVRALEMRPFTATYVPPNWIHRSVNVGDDLLVTFFSYPADAGQDYDIIRRAGGMKALVVEDGGGGWRLEDNPRSRPRAVG